MFTRSLGTRESLASLLVVTVIGCCGTRSSGAAEQPFLPPEYTVRKTTEPIQVDGTVVDEKAWEQSVAAGPFQFPWWKSGAKEPTEARLLWDDTYLYVACICSDEFITARTRDRDGPVAQDDCFEIMVAPRADRGDVYFNIEWNVIGGILDNFRPHGPRQPRAPKWDAQEVKIAGRFQGTLNDDTDRDQSWTVEVAIPFVNFRDYALHTPPRPGDVWRVNLNRHGGMTNVQYSQWSPGDTPTPSFHTPHRFGRLIFQK